jgi:HK97 family phage major capsid protein
MTKVDEIKQKRAELIAKQRELIDKSWKENRQGNLNSDEETTYQKIQDDLKVVEGTLKRELEVFHNEQLLNADAVTLPPAGETVQPDIRTIDENDKSNPVLQAYKAVTENRKISPAYENLVNRISRAGESYIRYGTGGMTPEEKRDLSVGSNAAGGYLVPIEMSKQIVIYEREFGVMRQLSTEFSTSVGDTVTVPRITAFGTSGWVGEGNAFTESDPTIGQVSFSAYKSTHIAQVSEELLQDTAFDVSSLLARIFGQNLGALQNNAFVSGNGTGRPTGIANNVTTGATLASNVAVTADELVNTYHSLLRPYRAQASWVIHDNTVAAIRKLVTGVSGDKTYLWQPGLVAGQPDTLLGRPVYTDPDVATMANSAKCILFGDFKAGYWIRNAGGITIQRLNELYSGTGQVGFRIWQRVDGKQVDALAVKAAVNNAS